MKKILLFFFLFSQFANSQVRYISPGFSLLWDSDGHFIFSPKISYGVLAGGYFLNVTLGASTSNNKLSSNTFGEVQFGRFVTLTNDITPFCAGGGLGLTIPNDDSNFSLRLSAFTGLVMFANANLLFQDTTRLELGSQIVLPIPLDRITM